MMQITEARPNGAFGLKVRFEKMMAGVLDWQRESPDGMRRLIASLYGVELNRHGGGIRTPKHADLYVGKRFAETRTLTESGTLSFGFLSGDFNPLHRSEERRVGKECRL